MQVIRSIDDFELACKQPSSLIIFSSLKACKPCRMLKEWLETDYTFELENIYYVDIYLPLLSDITDEIVVLPTLHLYQHSQKIKEVEGFNKFEIEPLLSMLNQTQTNDNCTLLTNDLEHVENDENVENKESAEHVERIENVENVENVKQVDGTPKTVDEILEELQKRLS